VTVATNMAGRGTDIKLGGNFEWRLKQALDEVGLVEGDPERLEEIDVIRRRVRELCDRDQAEVLELGGLYVLGTERHESRRIDNQLRGRSGRQGDVGESRFFLSLQDDLMRRFYRDWVTNAMEKLGMSEGVPIESRMVSRAIERAQKKVEDYNFEIRKSLLEYDEVMDSQRKTIYSMRQEVLEGVDLRPKIEGMLRSAIERAAGVHAGDAEGFAAWYLKNFGVEVDAAAAEAATERRGPEKKGDVEAAVARAIQRYDEREADITPELMRRVEQYLLLNTIDTRWKDHLHAIDSLKTGIGLRGYGQLDPKNEYKREGYELFEQLKGAVEDEISALILRIQVQRPATPPPGAEGQPGAQQQAVPTPTGHSGPTTLSGPAKTAQPAAAAAAAQRMAQQRAAAPRPVSPSQAFDLKRRREALAAMQRAQAQQQPGAGGAGPAPGAAAAPAAPATLSAKALEGVGRNDPCPCGSGQKFKKCHGQ